MIPSNRSLCLSILLAAMPAWASAQRVLMPGDRVEVRCAEDPTYCFVRTLSPEGRLAVPRHGSISLAKLTPKSAAAHLEAVLRDEVGPCRITVRLLGGDGRTVSVTGLVRKPGDHIVTAGLSMRKLLAGIGPQENADLRRVLLVSADGIERWVDCTTTDPLIRGGDRIEISNVAPRQEVNVLGGVKRPGVVTLEGEMLLQDAVSAAGGIDPHGDPSAVRIIRNGEPFGAILPEDARLRLQPGDEVLVNLRANLAFVSVSGAVKRPGVVAHKPGMKLTEALEAAGGPAVNGNYTAIEVRSILGKGTKRYSLLAILEGRQPNPVLSATDAVVVPVVRVKAGA